MQDEKKSNDAFKLLLKANASIQSLRGCVRLVQHSTRTQKKVERCFQAFAESKCVDPKSAWLCETCATQHTHTSTTSLLHSPKVNWRWLLFVCLSRHVPKAFSSR